MPSTALNSFTQHEILRQIGRQRLGKLFAPFEQELEAHNLVLPKPVPGSDDYFYELANVFTRPESLPENLRKTLFALEEAASPENDERLWTAIKRRIPCVSVSIDCPLDLTLELWFQAPDEFPALHSFSAGGPVQPPLHPDAHELAANSPASPRPSDGRGIKGEGPPSAFPDAAPSTLNPPPSTDAAPISASFASLRLKDGAQDSPQPANNSTDAPTPQTASAFAEPSPRPSDGRGIKGEGALAEGALGDGRGIKGEGPPSAFPDATPSILSPPPSTDAAPISASFASLRLKDAAQDSPQPANNSTDAPTPQTTPAASPRPSDGRGIKGEGPPSAFADDISVHPCPSNLRSSSEPTEDGSVVNSCDSQTTPAASPRPSDGRGIKGEGALGDGRGIKGEGPTSDGTSDSDVFTRLAALTPAQYDRARQAEAARLGIRLETLDAEVARCRLEADYDAQARAVKLPLIEPWPEPVDGQELLHEVVARFVRNVLLPPGAATVLALWPAHAHAFDAFLHTPRLNLTSTESECGKTTTLDLLATMTPRALRTEHLTAPVLFRLVDQHQPTLLLDEVDAYLPYAEELRGMLNAGHKQGACAYRCEGQGNAVRAFKAFAPAVLSGIGPLPDTLRSRSIRILLLPAEPEQIIAHFDSRHTEIETILCRKLARWAQDNFAALQACDPPMPPTAYNRVADNWRPLFAVAHIMGGDWPALALEAYHHLTNRPAKVAPHSFAGSPRPSDGRGIKGEGNGIGEVQGELAPLSNSPRPSAAPRPSDGRGIKGEGVSGEGRGIKGEGAFGRGEASPHSAISNPKSEIPPGEVLLLENIRQIFTATGATRISSKHLVESLRTLPTTQPSTLNYQLTVISLARRLRPFGITSRVMRFGATTAKGYDLSDFTRLLDFLSPPRTGRGPG